MIGVIQKILLDMLEGEGGTKALERVRRMAEVPEERVFRIDSVYPDDECLRMFRAAGDVLELDEDELYSIYADYFCRDALQRWPTWFQMSSSARAFLERQPVIHNCFATGLRDPEARRAVTDKFRIESRETGLVTHYSSPNMLCGLYKALGLWIVNHYNETVVIEEPRCMRRGDSECEIHILWGSDGPEEKLA